MEQTIQINEPQPTELDVSIAESSSQASRVSRTDLSYAITAFIFFALGVVVTLIATQNNRSDDQQLIEQAVAAALDARGESIPNSQPPAPVPVDPNIRAEVGPDDDPTFGPEDASVVVIEFSDFNCPYCGRFARDTLPPLLESYEGRVRFVYRDFPILSETSLHAAVAAECAADQDAFWEYHDLLFANQGSFNQDMLIRFAEELELDVEQFTICQDDPASRAEVAADHAEAQRLSVSGTPTFFINGRRIVGAQPYAVFQSAIDEELALFEEASSSDAP